MAYESIKELRLQCGMTQAQLADKSKLYNPRLTDY